MSYIGEACQVRFYGARRGDGLTVIRGNIETRARASWRMAVETLRKLATTADMSSKISLVKNGLNLYCPSNVKAEDFDHEIKKAIVELGERPPIDRPNITKLLGLADRFYIHPAILRQVVADLLTMQGLEVRNVEDLSVSPEGLHAFIALARSASEDSINAVKVNVPDYPLLDKHQIQDALKTLLGRPLVVIGGALEDDAHTVGIDAIMNAKGYRGHKGVESLNEVGHDRVVDVHNLLAQIPAETLIEKAIELKADAIFVSRILVEGTLYLQHLEKLSRLVAEAKTAGKLSQNAMMIIGGPRVDPNLVGRPGFEQITAVFGRDAYAYSVMSFVVSKLQQANKGGA